MEKRIYGIDSMRYFAAIAVVFIHCFPAGGTLKTLIDQLARFAVPFFFITSGYLLSIKLEKDDSVKTYLPFVKKIFLLYFGWNLVYAFDINPDLIAEVGFYPSIRDRVYGYFTKDLVAAIFEGIMYHLWFFSSLGFTVLIFMFFRLKNLGLFLAFGILLNLLGVIFYSYRSTPIGIPVAFNPRNLMFFSLLPFGLGLWTGAKRIKVSSITALGIWTLGIVLHFSELLYIYKYSPTDILVDSVFSTILMGLGAFLFAISENKWMENKTLASLGILSLGIYGSHMLVQNKLLFLKDYMSSSIWNYLLPVLVVLFSTLLTLILKRIRFLKELV